MDFFLGFLFSPGLQKKGLTPRVALRMFLLGKTHNTAGVIFLGSPGNPAALTFNRINENLKKKLTKLTAPFHPQKV